MKKIYIAFAFLCTTIISFAQTPSNYNGNSNTGFGGVIGTSSLSVTDDGTTITFTLTRGSAAFNDALTIYIDSKSGGSSNTSGFTDQGDYLRKAISGINGSGRSTVNFPITPAPFLPDYAIAMSPGAASFAGVRELVNGGSHNFIASANLSPSSNATATTYTFTTTKADLGITSSNIGFTFVATYGNPNDGSGYFRSNEGYGGGLPIANPGVSDVTFSTFFTYPLVVTPLFLNNFSGSVKNDFIELKWATVTESNLDKFILQKSGNGLNFVDLAEINPKNLSNGASYIHNDNNPNNGNNYYRIIARNRIGEKAYSNVVRIHFGKIDNTLTLFPNPTREFLKINFINTVRGTYVLDIMNDAGQRLLTQKFDHNGVDRVLSINLPPSMKKGPYRVHISNGYEFYKGTFIVQ